MQIKLSFNPKDRYQHQPERNNPRERRRNGPLPPIRDPEMPRLRKQPVLAETGRIHTEPPKVGGWRKIELLLGEFDELIGLHDIKEVLKEIAAFVEIQKQREQEGLATEPMTLHMIFKGSPGTGKTTVARLVGKLFKELGVLSKGHLIEVDRADLVGEYIGHTAQKTKDQLKKAAGGILFVDEAYSLGRGGEKDFGKEATDIMVKYMEDLRDDLIVILAGYTHEMDAFMASNPGLKSRFPLQLEFPDYTVMELVAIGKSMLKKRQYWLEDEALEELEKILRRAILQGHNRSGNARLVRNLIERAIRRQAVRLVKQTWASREDLMMITKADLISDSALIKITELETVIEQSQTI
jgi:stage V sporulation protein K